ncbi:hypothetical protein DPMN_153469 [Dreissena polymorpha]|uniref:Uncharacterized protein n=1 Tax=Dreissena polymorpha TaxID=45954 RepID=A0A9D4J4V1_DREPO|nr:hypothetical protein DPMN_153469 [Dreissena polymorpha]
MITKEKREKMKRYRQKKKEKTASALSVNKSVDLRSQKTAELSRLEKKAVKRTNACRMRIKLNKSIQQECSQTDCEIGNTRSARD